MNVVHLHSDEKFIYESSRFLDKDFKNYLLFYSDTNQDLTSKTRKMFEVKVLKNDKNLLDEIINVIKESKSTVLVVYDLDPTKIALINKLNLPIKVIWRFFGHELYKINKEKYLTTQTKRINREARVSFIRKILNYSIYRKNMLQKKFYFNYNFDYNNALSKIHGFMALCEEEYSYLNHVYGPLPQYINIPLDKLEVDETALNKGEAKIIIGNSRNDFNNHSEILEMIQPLQYKYILPFSYGSVNYYSKYIKKLAASKQVQILDRFIAFEKYHALLSSCTALVLNTRRQMAMGNIVLSIYKGLKIYLNEENSLFDFFKNNNIICYTIDSLKEDLEKDNLKLTNEQIIGNIEAFNTYCSVNDYTKFLSTIKNL